MFATFSKASLLNGIATLSLVTGFTLAPVHLDFSDGWVSITPASAWASGGNDHGMNDDDDDHDDDDDNDDDDDDQDGYSNDSYHSNGNNRHDDDDDDDDDDDHKDNRFGASPHTLADFLGSLNNGSRVIRKYRDGDEMEIYYSDGWKEKIDDGMYELRDPKGRIVIRRPVNARDLARLGSAF